MWIDNIKMDLADIGWDDVDWIDLAQNWEKWRALMNSVLNFWFHKMLGNYQLAVQLVTSRVVFSSI
jgi:hypothetical protein